MVSGPSKGLNGGMIHLDATRLRRIHKLSRAFQARSPCSAPAPKLDPTSALTVRPAPSQKAVLPSRHRYYFRPLIRTCNLTNNENWWIEQLPEGNPRKYKIPYKKVNLYHNMPGFAGIFIYIYLLYQKPVWEIPAFHRRSPNWNNFQLNLQRQRY